MDQNVCTPLPLPYGHLCKMLMFLFLFTFPFCMNNPDDGLFLNIINPMIIAITMFGMDSISTEIEDPFGDDMNDFEVTRIIRIAPSSSASPRRCVRCSR